MLDNGRLTPLKGDSCAADGQHREASLCCYSTYPQSFGLFHYSKVPLSGLESKLDLFFTNNMCRSCRVHCPVLPACSLTLESRQWRPVASPGREVESELQAASGVAQVLLYAYRVDVYINTNNILTVLTRYPLLAPLSARECLA